jgi:hypothetical protein
MRIYMDVCCLCRPFDDRAQDRIRIESEAVLTILGRCSQDWSLLGSEAIDFEVSMILDDKKRRDVELQAFCFKEKIVMDEEIINRAAELEKIGFRAMDALHISSAESSADIMLTADDNILMNARRNNKLIMIEIDNPVRWLMNVLQD